jgi:predicted AlkP superfamily phosphohydrolase/phosphomutase
MDELIACHGAHPMFEASKPVSTDNDQPVYCYSIPSSYDLPALKTLRDHLVTGAGRRTKLMLDLLGRESWDLFLGVFSETHTASHLLWHTSRDHPLQRLLMRHTDADPLLDVFRAVDVGVGEILSAVPEDADILLFSIYGIAANVLDLPSMAMLPELLFRWSFPGQEALGGAGKDTVRHDYPGHWREEIWKLRTPTGEARLESPAVQQSRGDPMHWQPSNWYRPLWPEMKAFALPTYSEGLVRINLQGRERYGLVAAEDYQKTCDELCDYLYALKDGRTGRPMVREIVPRKTHPMDDAALGPPADLIVLWQEDSPIDLVESPQCGRIGPLPYFRSGGHCSRGFVAARGPGIEPGSQLESLRATDLTATLLDLMDRDIPGYIDGHSVLRQG